MDTPVCCNFLCFAGVLRNKYLCNEIDDDDDDDDDGDIDAKEIPMMPMILMMTSRI